MQAEDGSSIQDPADEGLQNGEDYFRRVEADQVGPDPFVWPDKTNVDVAAVVRNAYARVDNLHDDVQRGEDMLGPDPELEEDVPTHSPDFDELVRESTKPYMKGAN